MLFPQYSNINITTNERSRKLRRLQKLKEFHHYELPSYLATRVAAKMAEKGLVVPVDTNTAALRITQSNSSQKLIKFVNNSGNDTLNPMKQFNSISSLGSSLKQKPPQYHPPWELYKVVTGHQGWVHSICLEPYNQWFATGSSDKTIKIWDLASCRLKLTLTGHIMSVRGLVISPRHPYLFSAGEDKMIKCWDLEQNKVVRHYHGHLSAIYAIDLHPNLDVLVTVGRDAVARIWDIRTRESIMTLSGHKSTINDVKFQASEPQLITASSDETVRLWNIQAGKTLTTLTHHKKSVRALALHPSEFTFSSASPSSIKQWKFPEGDLVLNYDCHDAIINTLSVNPDGVLFSGGDNGTIGFFDWKTGHKFQETASIPIPGSIESENGIFASTFDKTGTRLLTCETDKSIKIWKEKNNATPDSDPNLPWKPKFYGGF